MRSDVFARAILGCQIMRWKKLRADGRLRLIQVIWPIALEGATPPFYISIDIDE